MNAPKIKVVLYRNRTYNDGSHPIMIRITQNRKAIYKAVGYSVLPDAWDEENHCVYEKKPILTKKLEGQFSPSKIAELKSRYPSAIVVHNARHINIAIKDKIDEVSDISEKLKVNDEALDLKNIKSQLNPSVTGDRNKSFLVFGKEYRDNFLKAGSVGTYRRYKSVINNLEKYIKKKDLLFSDITINFLQDYRAHMLSKENKTNTLHNNLKSIRAIYYDAIAQQIITAEKNPFFVFKIATAKGVKKDRLTVEEIITLEKLNLEKDSLLSHVRNFFLFSFYCAGIRVGDVLQLKWSNINSVYVVKLKWTYC